MKSYSSRDLIKLIEADGRQLVTIVGSHHHYRHPTKCGKVTIPHPKRDLPLPTVKSILYQAKIKL